MPRAVLYDRVGDPSVLYVDEVTTPEPDEGQVVVRVVAAALNPFDAKMRSGFIPTPPDAGFPRGIGSDFAGVVIAAGDDVTAWDGTPLVPGDAVLGWTMGSALRDELVVQASSLARKPAGLPFVAAAALATSGLTARAALDFIGIHRGDTVLLSAAAGGVGLLYAQLAIGRGAMVVGTASRDKHDLLRSIGVVPVEYGPGLADRVRAVAPGPITAAQDNHGRETVLAALDLGVPPERICTIVDYPAVDEFGIVTTGRYERRPENLQALADLAARGRLTVRVERTFPLDDAAEAFTLLEGRHVAGKLVVTP